MKMRLKYIILFLFPVFILNAQSVSFVATAPKYVKVGEQFQLQFTLNKNIDDFTPPDFSDFELLGGPMQGSSTNISIVNGRTERIFSYSLTYFLSCKKPGKYTIVPAQASIKGSIYKSNQVEVEVVGSANQSQGQQGGNVDEKSPTTNETPEGDMFLSLILNKKSVYYGEQISAWVKIYTKESLSDIDPNYKGPEFQGFYKDKLDLPPLRSLVPEKVGNDVFYSGAIEKMMLYPQKSGKLRIEPFDLTVYVQRRVKQTGNIIDDFFGPSYKNVPVKLTSKPVIVDVKPLPSNQPDGFTGAVGNFSISSTISSESVKTNDAITFKVTISGKGNIRLIENINYEFPPSLEVYDPVIKTNIDNSGSGGTKTFEITAIPREAGTFDIKPFKLVFFDPVSAGYKTVETQGYTLEVRKNTSDTNMVMMAGTNKEDVEFLASDIRYIITNSEFQKSNKFLINNISYYLAYGFLGLFLLFILFIKRKRKESIQNQQRKNNKLAIKRLNKKFKKVSVLLKQGKKDIFYEELSKAIWNYLSDKLGISYSTLTTDSIKEELLKRNLDITAIDSLLGILSECEFARYTSGSGNTDIGNLYSQAVNIILNMDQKL